MFISSVSQTRLYMLISPRPATLQPGTRVPYRRMSQSIWAGLGHKSPKCWVFENDPPWLVGIEPWVVGFSSFAIGALVLVLISDRRIANDPVALGLVKRGFQMKNGARPVSDADQRRFGGGAVLLLRQFVQL